MATLTMASAQYMNRPKDESFASLDALIEHKRHEQARSKEVTYNIRDLRVVPAADDVMIASPKGQAQFTHWSFSQMARMIKAPAGYLRTLSPAIIAEAMNHGITSGMGDTATLLVKAPNGNPLPVVRAITSETYGRVWDADLYDAANRMVFQSKSSGTGDGWTAPPTWSGESAGTWAGDRDSFVIRVDGGSIVNDPSLRAGKDGRMYRGIIIRNSEVGAASIVIDWVLFQYICGNLMLWGATIDRKFRRRHVGANAVRDSIRELGSLARQWTTRSASQDEAILRGLMTRELAHTPEAVQAEMVKMGYTQEQARAVYTTCIGEFDANPRSYWGVAQGTTKLSQEQPFQSDRFALDMLAAKVMERGNKVLA